MCFLNIWKAFGKKFYQAFIYIFLRPLYNQLHKKRIVHLSVYIFREKGRDLTQSCDKNPYTHRIIQTATWQHKNATKTLITQLSRTDLGRCVGETAVTQLVWLNRLRSFKPRKNMFRKKKKKTNTKMIPVIQCLLRLKFCCICSVAYLSRFVI